MSSANKIFSYPQLQRWDIEVHALLKQETDNIQEYLSASSIVDFDAPEVEAVAQKMSEASTSETEFILNAYKFVRDEIRHSADFAGKIVTCKASEVLETGEGICYSKSHLLAALLRHGSIPTGFCYQLLRLDGESSPLVLHGLNAVYLQETGKWMRIDARGNKPGVNAQFCVDKEQIAFSVRAELGEIDYNCVFAEPNESAVKALVQSRTFDELWRNLPQRL